MSIWLVLKKVFEDFEWEVFFKMTFAFGALALVFASLGMTMTTNNPAYLWLLAVACVLGGVAAGIYKW